MRGDSGFFRGFFSVFFACLAVSHIFSHPAHAATIRLNPPIIELSLEPGETASGEIAAENPTGEELKARIYLEDWSYARGGTGEKIFSPPSSAPASASRWITFSPAETVIKPFGRITARYTVTVPKDAKGGHRSVLFFETFLGTTENEEGVSIAVAGRIGSLFFIEVKGTVERKGEIQNVAIRPPQGNEPMRIETTFKNTGNVDVALGGNFLILDKEGRVEGRGDLAKIYTAAGAAEARTTEWVGRLPQGTYTLLLTYDLGKGKSLVEEKTFTL